MTAGKRKRILHLIDSGGMYGAESVIINLSREMMRDGNYEPVIGCMVCDPEKDVDLLKCSSSFGVEGHKVLVKNSVLFRDLPRASRFLRKIRVDLVHSHGYKATVYGFVLKLITGIPVIATCHLWFTDKRAPLKMRGMLAVERYLFRYLPAVVAVSERIKEELLSSGADANKIHVVNNGIVLTDYTSVWREQEDRLVDELGLGADDICVVNIGRLTRQKNQRAIIKAALKINERRHELRIFIVGEGGLRNELLKQIRDAKVGRMVTLLGFRDDIKALLQRADIFVLASLDEGMPMSLLEAVASGVPVITTKVGDIPKLVMHDESGVIVDIGDTAGLAQAIESLADDPDARSELAERAWEKVKKLYSSSVMFEQYRDIYTRILSR